MHDLLGINYSNKIMGFSLAARRGVAWDWSNGILMWAEGGPKKTVIGNGLTWIIKAKRIGVYAFRVGLFTVWFGLPKILQNC